MNAEDSAGGGGLPDVLFILAVSAATLVHNAGLVGQFTGINKTGSWVASQSPVGGTVVARGSTVTMVLHSGATP